MPRIFLEVTQWKVKESEQRPRTGDKSRGMQAVPQRLWGAKERHRARPCQDLLMIQGYSGFQWQLCPGAVAEISFSIMTFRSDTEVAQKYSQSLNPASLRRVGAFKIARNPIL